MTALIAMSTNRFTQRPIGQNGGNPSSDLESQRQRASNKAKSKNQAAVNSIGVTPEMEQTTFDFAVTSLERDCTQN